MPFKSNQTVYFDTSLFIYYFENHPRKAPLAEVYFTQAAKPGVKLIVSQIILTELLIAPLKTKDQKLNELYSSLELSIPNLTILPITQDILMSAASLRVQYHLKTPDAIHLATAQNHNATYFLTADHSFAKIKTPKVILV